MKSKAYRTFTINKKKYHFDSDKFSNILNKYRHYTDKKGKRVFIKDIINQIAEKASVSPEAVSNWKKGNNGPSDIELVKICAKVLDVNYMSLLTQDIEEEKNSITEEDTKAIYMVYEGIQDILQIMTDMKFDPELYGNKISYLERGKKRSKRKTEIADKQKEALSKLENEIYKLTPKISENIMNRLLKIVIESYSLTIGEIPSRWDRIEYINYENNNRSDKVQSIEWSWADGYYAYESRDVAIGTECGRYLDDEIFVAEKMGFDREINYPDDTTDMDEYYQDIDVDVKKYEKYGCDYLHPVQVYHYLVSGLITIVFKNDFPEYFDN